MSRLAAPAKHTHTALCVNLGGVSLPHCPAPTYCSNLANAEGWGSGLSWGKLCVQDTPLFKKLKLNTSLGFYLCNTFVMQFCKIDANKTLQLYSTVSFFGGEGVLRGFKEIFGDYSTFIVHQNSVAQYNFICNAYALSSCMHCLCIIYLMHAYALFLNMLSFIFFISRLTY